jgi:hypothetical protein
MESIMQTIHFNTGRLYTANGQRVTATLHEDGTVTFFDHDRMIDGQFTLGLHCQFNQVEVMHWYDSGMTCGTKRSWQDGMLKGGCNATYRTYQPA